MKLIRFCIAEFLKILYDNKDILIKGIHLNYAVDEILLSAINHSQKLVIGVICTSNRSLFRCNLTKIRDTNYLSQFITKNVERLLPMDGMDIFG